MKPRRLVLLLVVGGGVLLLLLAVWRPGGNEPRYQGKTLSTWLEECGTDPAATQRATNAIRHLGTNALPLLVKWLHCEPAKWRTRLHSRMNGSPPGGRLGEWLLYGPEVVRARRAFTGFRILGPEAAPAAPALVEMLVRPDPLNRSGTTAHLVLMLMGEKGLAPLVSVVTNKAAPARSRCLAADMLASPLMDPGTNANWAVSPLVACLADTNVAGPVAWALGALNLEPDLVVPALTGALRTNDLITRLNAAGALGKYGKAAVPELLAATTNLNAMVRQAATNGLVQIAPETLPNDANAALPKTAPARQPPAASNTGPQ